MLPISLTSRASFSSPFTNYLRRLTTAALFLAAVSLSCIVLYRASDSVGLDFSLTTMTTATAASQIPYASAGVDSPPPTVADSEERRLETVLKDAANGNKTVILTTLNEAWASPNSIFDLFLESFRIGESTQTLLNHVVIIALDQKAFARCLLVHAHCFALTTEGVDFSKEAYFMTPDYLKMMWRRIDFLRSILEMGYNFVFTDADVMWLRDPFPRFFLDADFQIACDYFSGKPDDVVRNMPNGGYTFVRSNNRTIEFYKFWYASRETYPGLHDQDVLNRIKNRPFIKDIGLKMKFLDTRFFGGFCEPSKDLNHVCTMHANCCYGLNNKVHDLRLMLQDWKQFLSLPPPPLKRRGVSSWSIPQKCRARSHRP